MVTSPLASPSATIGLLEAHGLSTKKSLGQHFLIDDNIVRRIMDLAALSGDETALEVGPGIGTLTVALCAAAGSVVAVERDPDLVPVLAQTTAGCPRFALIHADAALMTAEQVSAPFGAPDCLIANLPYQVAATVVLRVFESMPSVKSATVMVQAEVADRMCAVPSTKSYGAYTVKLALRARAVGRFAVPPGCFLPPPRVESSVIRLDRVEEAHDQALVVKAAQVADAAFSQRRKTVRNSLRARLGVPADLLDDALATAGIDGRLRAEALSPAAFIELARALGGITF